MMHPYHDVPTTYMLSLAIRLLGKYTSKYPCPQQLSSQRSLSSLVWALTK